MDLNKIFDINGVDQFGSSNHFDVISIHDANKFEINNPYEYGALPVGTALNALVVPHRQKSSIDQAGLSVPYRSAVSKTIQKQVFPTTELYACTEVGCNNQNYDFSNLEYLGLIIIFLLSTLVIIKNFIFRCWIV